MLEERSKIQRRVGRGREVEDLNERKRRSFSSRSFNYLLLSKLSSASEEQFDF